MSGPTLRQRPGLAKARLSLVALRQGPSARAEDPAWRDLFAAADAVSEGSARREAAGVVWYGSTSLILPLPAAYGPGAREFVAAVAERDPHVRLRALRVARREASSRAPGPLGRLVCELRFSTVAQGLRIDVDVQAPLIEVETAGPVVGPPSTPLPHEHDDRRETTRRR